MPYTSRLEKQRRHAAELEQKERARWMNLMDAIKRVQEKEPCSEQSAAQQLITAIVDEVLAARWDDAYGLERVAPSELSGTVQVCLYEAGFVERKYVAQNSKSAHKSGVVGEYPTIEVVYGPVEGAICDVDRLLVEGAPPTWIALLVSKEDMDRWPFDSTVESAKTGKDAPSPHSRATIRNVLWKIFRENPSNPPDMNLAARLVRKELRGASRNLIWDVLREPEFSEVRPRRGRRTKQ